MRDHKDLTDYSSLPVLEYTGPTRKLTADECQDKADETQALLATCIDSRTRGYLRRELRGWLRLAAERSGS